MQWYESCHHSGPLPLEKGLYEDQWYETYRQYIWKTCFSLSNVNHVLYYTIGNRNTLEPMVKPWKTERFDTIGKEKEQKSIVKAHVHKPCTDLMHRKSLHKAYPFGALAGPAPRVPCAKRCTGGAQPMNNRIKREKIRADLF